MRKAIFATVMALLAMTFAALVIQGLPGTTGLPSVCLVELEKYIACKESSKPGTMIMVQSASRASKPWNFSRDMSCTSFGDTMYYRTDQRYAGKSGGGLRALPFPPKRMWCILLKRDQNLTGTFGGEATCTIVFAALHQDMYSAAWVIHEGPGELSNPQLMESLTTIGCELTGDELASSCVEKRAERRERAF